MISKDQLKNKKLSPYLVELTKDALLKAFWRRNALRRFLLQHSISENYLSAWTEGVTKRVFLDEMFDKLVVDKHSLILGIASSISEMKSFPDLEGWEDSQEKISIAYRAAEKLRIENSKMSKMFDAEKEAINRREITKHKVEEIEKANSALLDMSKGLQELSLEIGTQPAGYKFENWFYNLAQLFDIVARKPYKDKHGRQIDGAITLDGTTFLLETKFTKEPIGSQDIDIFLSKINRKADNTMGLMVSISGFNLNAVETASQDRTPLILMDYTHFYNLIFPQLLSLPEVIQRIWRNASQTGRSFLPVQEF